ncbi:TIGR01777 family oxidoreductase [Microbulbifer agarilyticus]|uniref:TIGR01777 family oxidoreductase n=1 Tax=Microbulbifer agarilyticus TaxID=260552 RepID=UPI001CD7DB39|nr:TIGR01777 family oxidoreductase [Microbulbifer agarilyticus]MCA0901836.1 TIGR01777 family oxidoreductase [Microbulbifer agarilyticus]
MDARFMHCLITGGTGLIGRQFCSKWLERGNSLTVLSRSPEKVRRLCGESATAVNDLGQIDRPVDIVVNLAGETISKRWSEARKAEIRRSRIETTNDLVRWILAQPQRPKYVLSGSAVGFYGDRGGDLLKETSGPGGGFAAQLCRDWEAATLPLQQAGICVGIMRTSIVLSPDGGALKEMLPAFKAGLGGPMGSGEQWMSWIHEADIVGLILHAIDRHLCVPFNACAPEPVTNSSFSRLLAKQLHRPCLLRTPEWLLKILFGEMAEELLLASQRMEPRTALDSGYSFQYPTLEKALADLLAPQGGAGNTHVSPRGH